MTRSGTAGGLWALVPVKRLGAAKQRLAAVLAPAQRIELAKAMLEDVLDVLAELEELAGILVLTGDPEVADLARRRGARVEPDPTDDGTNPAVQRGMRLLHDEGHGGVVVVPGDIPFVSEAELRAVAAAVSASPVVIVPATRDGGTNVLAVSPPALLPPSFGEGSFARHVEAARGIGLEPTILRLGGAGHDVDVADDLMLRDGECAAPRTSSFLNRTAAALRSSQARLPRSHPDMPISAVFKKLSPDARLTRAEAMSLVEATDLRPLLAAAAARRDEAHGEVISYSRKVFIPLTQLCRDVCHYCTFAHPPRKGERAFLSRDEVLAIARAGREAGCREALFTLGDKPELRYRLAREELQQLGHATTLSYLAEVAELVFRETGLLPHLNPGLLSEADIASLRRVSVSQGIMLESVSERLCGRGGPHHGSPDKHPAARLETIRLAGAQAVPFTSGILIGIGETRAERIESLLALRDLNDAYGHIQEIIIQNFRPKPGTRMGEAEAPSLEEHLWTIAVARLLFEPEMTIQAPPNLSPGALGQLIAAGINDWGGVSPVTPDHVNPEAPWPHLVELEAITSRAGKKLTERLAIYPGYAARPSRWVDERLRTRLLNLIDADGWPRADEWCPGRADALPTQDVAWLMKAPAKTRNGDLKAVLDKVQKTSRLTEAEIVRLFRARDEDFSAVCRAADDLRRAVNGDTVSYVVTRNINYTNICSFKCQFCAFSKGKLSENLRGRPYDLEMAEIAERVRQAWDRGASEVCMQGGIHPSYTGSKYLDLCGVVKSAVPQIHMHAFSPLEVFQGARTLGIPVSEFLVRLKSAGLDTLPGTAAEILDDQVREQLCPDKIRTGEWLEVMRTAHELGFRSTATIMFGHIDRYEHWARHLMRVRDLQAETGGFTEFVPLPFVHMEAPIYLKGRSRPGPTFRETVLMHAVARLALHPHISNIQASWVKLGRDGVRVCLAAGVNDLGGTLMDESISRAAGAGHGQEMTPAMMEEIIRSADRMPRQRTTLYQDAPSHQVQRSFRPRLDQRQGRAQTQEWARAV